MSLEPVDGPPSAVAVLDETGAVQGYIFSTLDVIQARGFVSTPFDAIAGIRPDGTITGATQVFNRDTFVYRDEVYNRDDPSLKGLAELIVAKHRNGETGDVKLVFKGETTRFFSFDPAYATAEPA